MQIDDDDVPNIQAQCAGCGFLFDMRFGLDCPACHHIGVKWAQLVSKQEASEVNMHEVYRRKRALSEGDRKEIEWLEKLYSL